MVLKSSNREDVCIDKLIRCFDYMDERKNTPHPVHVISNAAFGRVFHKHSIVLEGLVRFKTETDVWRTFYRKIAHVGKSIWPMWQNQTKRKPLCVSKTKQNYLLVLTRCAELMSFEDVILVKPDDAEVEADDLAVLLLAVHRDIGASDDNLCTQEHITLAAKAKQSIRDKEGKKLERSMDLGWWENSRSWKTTRE